MRASLILLLAAIAAAQGAEPPSGLHITALHRSDAAPFWSAYLMELRRQGPEDWELRWSRIAPTNAYCLRLDVKSDARRVSREVVARVFQSVNPCNYRSEEVSEVYSTDQLAGALDHPVDFWIVSDCYGERKVIKTPQFNWTDDESLKRKRSVVTPLRDLYWDLVEAAGYGDRSPFHGLTDEEDLRLQRQGAAIVPELRSGRYDEGLQSSWAVILTEYDGPRDPADFRPKPVLVHGSSSQGVELVGPDLKYPLLARRARIQGRVSMPYEVETATGKIRTHPGDATGHPFLIRAANQGLDDWRVANYRDLSPGTFTAVIEYDLDAPPSCAAERE